MAPGIKPSQAITIKVPVEMCGKSSIILSYYGKKKEPPQITMNIQKVDWVMLT
jgi:hypothetical protein